MKAGDLVRHTGDGDLGLILSIEEGSDFPYLVLWLSDPPCLMTDMALELISESR